METTDFSSHVSFQFEKNATFEIYWYSKVWKFAFAESVP